MMFETCERADANHHHHHYDLLSPEVNSSICVPRIALLRKSFSYHKIPPQPLNLSVVKLDGSTFEVQVPRIATVARLLEAVKDVFDQSANDDEMISWPHVWGHFCLSYNGKKLLDYKECIRLIGIKDGDELCFVRHLSVNYQ